MQGRYPNTCHGKCLTQVWQEVPFLQERVIHPRSPNPIFDWLG